MSENENGTTSQFSHMYARFCEDKEFIISAIDLCLDLPPPTHANDFQVGKCYRLKWTEDGHVYPAQICFLGTSYEYIEQELKEKSKTRFRFKNCRHDESNSDADSDFDEDEEKKRQEAAQKAKKESVSKAKQKTDRMNLEKKLDAMNKKSILHDSPPQSDVQKEVSRKKRKTPPIQKSYDKSAEEDFEISSSDSSPAAREVQRRVEEKKRELEQLNRILQKYDAQKRQKSRTNRRLSFNEECEGFENTGMLGNRSETNSPAHAIVSTKNDQKKRSSGDSTCKDFFIDPKTLYNDVVKERYSERAAALPRYELFQHINQRGEQIKCVHLSEGYFIPYNAWELINLEKAYSKFIKYLAQALWGEYALANSYVEDSQNMVQIPERSPRKKVDPNMKAVLIQCLNDKFEERKEAASTRLVELRKVGTYLGQHIGNIRRRMYPNTVQKKK